MINTVKFAGQTTSLRPLAATDAPSPAPAPTPAPDPGPGPTVPADSVNFDSIDCPVKAALLPVLDPAVLAGIVVGALVGGSTAAGAMVSANILTGTNPRPSDGGSMASAVRSSFIIDTKNQQVPVTEGGLMGDTFDSGRLTVDQSNRTAKWIQAGGTDLTFSPDDDNRSLKVDGRIGSVETHLALSRLNHKGDDPADVFGVHAEGTLGDQAYSVDTTFTVSSSNTRGGDGASVDAKISARGKLGTLDIAKDYVATASQTADNASLQIHGQGVVAGVPTQVDVEAHIAH